MSKTIKTRKVQRSKYSNFLKKAKEFKDSMETVQWAISIYIIGVNINSGSIGA